MMMASIVTIIDGLESVLYLLVIYACGVYIYALWPAVQREYRQRHAHPPRTRRPDR